jgi:hypothetical protein
MKRRRFTKRQAAKAKGYRSGLEVGLAEALTHVGINGEYEQHKIKYIKPATNHTYTPDFRLPNGIFIETKGRFVAEDRKKHILIKDQHPELDIRFVFQNSKNKIRKGSNTTYADWCEKHGFQYADKTIPETWLNSQ